MCPNNLNKKNGFTLIELLIALFIFTIVSVIMTNALHTVFTTQTNTDAHAKRIAEMQIAFTLLSRDVEQIIDRPVTLANNEIEKAFLGGEDNMVFTHAGLSNPLGQLQRSTLQRTRYRVEKNNLVRESWDMLDQTTHTKTSQRTLLSNVTTIHFDFLDKDNHFQNQWPSADPSNTADLPKAVRVTLTLRDLGKITQLYLIPAQPAQTPGQQNANPPPPPQPH